MTDFGQFSIKLAEEDNTQYWFIIVPAINIKFKTYVIGCILDTFIMNNYVMNNYNGEKDFRDFRDARLPRLVILLADGKSPDINKSVLNLTVSKPGDYLEDMIKITNLMAPYYVIPQLQPQEEADTIMITNTGLEIIHTEIDVRFLQVMKHFSGYLAQNMLNRDSYTTSLAEKQL